jgi:hypothetical protein
MFVNMNPLFTTERRKSTPNVTLNILESMIKYTLISSILDKICEMTKKTLKYPRYDIRPDPLWHFLKIRTWGT